MSKNLILVDLEDERTAKIADVISNKTAKKILSLLADKELSESELADSLKIPLNTVGYNIKKLEEVGLIEKVGGFLWSVKGKRIHKYRVSNKRIVISPRKIVKGVLPAVLISLAFAFGIKIWSAGQIMDSGQRTVDFAMKAEEEMAAGASAEIATVSKAAENGGSVLEIAQNLQHVWLWFLAGALVALFIYLAWNWRKE